MNVLLISSVAAIAVLVPLLLRAMVRVERMKAAEESLRRRLSEKDEECARALADKERLCDRLLSEKAAACAAALAEKDRTCEKIVREQFANLAAQTLKVQSGDLGRMNKEQIEAVLKPLREQMAKLQEATLKAEVDRSNLKASITENIGAIGSIAGELAKTASALSSNTRVQGRKGEDILTEKLIEAGLERNVNFFLQEGAGGERPDAQVCDAENRWLVIDSKVSLTAYMEYASAKDEVLRKSRLKAHVASVKQRIDELARAKYPKTLGAEYPQRDYLPVTAMFVPYEAPLMEALREDSSLLQHAVQNNVVIVTPLTLLAYLRLVYLAWQHRKEMDNRQDIVNTARELLSRMNGFLMAFERIGKAIDALQEVYHDARGVIVDAPRAQTIAKAANRLIDLHVRLESRKGRRIEKADCLADVAAEEEQP